MSKQSLAWIRSKQQKQRMSGEQLAAYLVLQLEHLDAVRKCAARLMARDQRGRDFFVRGETEFVSFASQRDRLKDLAAAYQHVVDRTATLKPALPQTSLPPDESDDAGLPLFEYGQKVKP